MVRTIASIVCGFLIWLISIFVTTIISVYIWEHSVNSYAANALICWVGTWMAIYIGLEVMRRISPPVSERFYLNTLAIVVLAWAASSMISGVDIDYKIVALLGHGLPFLMVCVPRNFHRKRRQSMIWRLAALRVGLLSDHCFWFQRDVSTEWQNRR
jgi:positive regulator of sigma E activity